MKSDPSQRDDRPAGPFLSSGPLPAFGLIAFYVLLWTVYAQITSFNLDLHGDMVENYAWGINWEAGYYKHPPLFAWITAAWFLVFPETDFAYRLLASVNVAAGLAGLWLLARRLLPERLILLSLCLAFFLPPLTTLAANYNANSGMIPFWAFILVAYLHLIERRTILSAALFGAVAALGILMKYHTALLLMSLVLHVLWEKDLRALILTRLTIIVAAAYFLLLAPHILWLFRTGFMTFDYARSQSAGTVAGALESVAVFAPTLLAYCLPAILLLIPTVLIARRYGPARIASLRERMGGNVAARALAFATFGPILSTMAVGLAMGADISGVWLIPVFVFVPLYIAMAAAPLLETAPVRIAPIVTLGIAAILLALSPIIGQFLIKQARSNAVVPVQELAERVDAVFAQLTPAPIAIAGGETFLANAMSFYSSHHPRVMYDTPQHSPWVEPGEERMAGAVYICRAEDKPCSLRGEKRLGGADSIADISLATPPGSPVPAYRFRVQIKLPAAATTPAVN